MSELKACPFCGGEPRLLYGLEGEYAVGCSNDNCEFCGEDSRDNQKVITQWNTRPIEDALRAELATAQAEVERLRGIIRNVENLGFDWPGGECRECCDSHPGEEHEPACSFYQWEGGAK